MRIWSDGTTATIWSTESGMAYGWFDDAAGKTFADTTGFVPLVVDDMVSWGELISQVPRARALPGKSARVRRGPV